ncbi:FAD/NAD(P)-binding protein [Angustibacter sp. McL0619]|uniref:FAD/NAD(P)-binding protein n=1 Tax=Angustibacter sp. McL0619 TaxID=3415676 RepID=UPI003CF60462
MTQQAVAPGQVADIAVVGAGPAGSLVVVQLLRAMRRDRRRGSIVLVDPAAADGGGVAFSTADERHLLNVRVAGLDAHPDEPGHFLAWARAHVAADVGPGDFLPRSAYGDYLRQTLQAELGEAPPGVRVSRRHARVRRLAVHDATTPVTLELDDGSAVTARRVVLATGAAATSDVVVTMWEALDAVVEERWAEAVRSLRLLGPWLSQLGGSAAQREIVEDTLLDALVHAGRCEEARLLLTKRLDRRQSALDRRRLAAIPA